MVKSQILIIFIFFNLYLNFKLIKKIIKTLLRFKISEDIIGKTVNINFSNSNYTWLSTNIVMIVW
ncbi:hypothetical protein ACX27_24250 [Nostoc piscinale CENA21]|uniref:Uncharacterized protein n=1 Tax=Nostoc piscinale CENA21 TaxID=224013 RepID=A0A0M3V687_9NOSO|nr:hypothetical protein ACX27_24250 [Nostoc piscinale CENA21]